MPKFKVAVAALLLAGTVPLFAASTASQASAASTSITVAEAPGASPNYIFPFMNCSYDTSNNVNYFQRLLYRPLYWYGVGPSIAEAPSLSLANQPVFDKARMTATLTVKPWRFANGQYLTARSVMFFLNLWVADPTGFCPYESGLGIPDQLRGAVATGNTVRLFFTKPMNPTWIMSNFLSLITPLPEAWDRSSARTMSHCSSGSPRVASTVSSCRAVLTYLQTLGGETSTFTNGFWRSGVDGPWTLSSLAPTGTATFSVNHAYAGHRPLLTSFTEVAYQSAAQEVRDLQSGKLDVANLDFGSLSGAAAQANLGTTFMKGLSATDNVTAGSNWSIAYLPFNFGSANTELSLVKQPYVRAAMQRGIDQAAIVRDVFGGYGEPGYGPLPTATTGGPTPSAPAFDPVGAEASLIAHGWRLVNGVLTCVDSGSGASQCGTGIATGTSLSMTLLMSASSPQFTREVNAIIADWKSLGIVVNVQFASYAQVVAACASTTAQLCAWDSGWSYLPSVLPTGELLFSSTGSSNVGSFSNPLVDALINQTMRANVSLARYATVVAASSPAIFIPQGQSLTESAKNLASTVGLAPNPLGSFTPEYYHW